MQTMPSFVYLIPALMFFGLGKVPAVFATVIYAVPPVIRLSNVGIRGVPASVVEAAQAFGATSRQILFEVQLPLAFPSIMVGVNQTTMMALAMVVIASMIGARGLGMEVLLAINRIEVGRGFEAGLSIVLLAILIDRITHAFASRQGHSQPGG
jgi:glycine betaine/proline transport system permease protein